MSSRFEGEVYSSAALDPTPLPGLILLLMLCLVPLLFATTFFMVGFVEPVMQRMIIKSAKKMLDGVSDRAHRVHLLERKRKGVALSGVVVMVLFGVLTFVGFTLQNNATKVWRAFNANLEIVAAHQTDAESKLARAQFRQMKSKADFERLQVQLDRGAQRSGVTLEWYGM
jgi:hypothetical protein